MHSSPYATPIYAIDSVFSQDCFIFEINTPKNQSTFYILYLLGSIRPEVHAYGIKSISLDSLLSISVKESELCYYLHN